MKPFLRVTFRNGTTFNVPTAVIVNDYATYHHRTDPARTLEQCASEAQQLFSASEFELVDWVKNNMNWSDLKAHARAVEHRPLDMEAAWCDAEVESIEALDQPVMPGTGDGVSQAPLELLLSMAASNELRASIAVFSDPATDQPFAMVACLLGAGQEVTAYANMLDAMARKMDDLRRASAIDPASVAPGSSVPS